MIVENQYLNLFQLIIKTIKVNSEVLPRQSQVFNLQDKALNVFVGLMSQICKQKYLRFKKSSTQF